MQSDKQEQHVTHEDNQALLRVVYDVLMDELQGENRVKVLSEAIKFIKDMGIKPDMVDPSNPKDFLSNLKFQPKETIQRYKI